MAETLPIAQLGNPVLRQVAQPIYSVHAEWVQVLIQRMMATMHQSNGVGIAAPQVGQSHRLLIVASRPNARYPHAPQMDPMPMINPCLVSYAESRVKDWEGCLSVPGIRGWVPRYPEVEVEFTTQDGKRQRSVFSGFVARVFQHEMDHLEGLVFLDRLESVQDIITDQEYLKRMG